MLKISLEEDIQFDRSIYLRPITTKVFEFRTKRIYFKRRVSH